MLHFIILKSKRCKIKTVKEEKYLPKINNMGQKEHIK